MITGEIVFTGGSVLSQDITNMVDGRKNCHRTRVSRRRVSGEGQWIGTGSPDLRWPWVHSPVRSRRSHGIAVIHRLSYGNVL